MKVVAMIPARYNASRFPGKLMKDLSGKPVIIRTYEATLNTKLFDDVIVITDSKIIYSEVKKCGGNVLMSDKNHESGSDRIAEAAINIDCDIIVNVQGDEPFVEIESLKSLINVFNSDDADKIDLASLMVKIKDNKDIDNPNCVKVITDKNNFAIYFSRSKIPYNRSTNNECHYFKHKGVYAFKKSTLLEFTNLPMTRLERIEKIECLRFLEYGKKIKMVESNVQGVEIDTPSDLSKAIKLWNS